MAHPLHNCIPLPIPLPPPPLHTPDTLLPDHHHSRIHGCRNLGHRIRIHRCTRGIRSGNTPRCELVLSSFEFRYPSSFISV